MIGMIESATFFMFSRMFAAVIEPTVLSGSSLSIKLFSAGLVYSAIIQNIPICCLSVVWLYCLNPESKGQVLLSRQFR